MIKYCCDLVIKLKPNVKVRSWVVYGLFVGFLRAAVPVLQWLPSVPSRQTMTSSPLLSSQLTAPLCSLLPGQLITAGQQHCTNLTVSYPHLWCPVNHLHLHHLYWCWPFLTDLVKAQLCWCSDLCRAWVPLSSRAKLREVIVGLAVPPMTGSCYRNIVTDTHSPETLSLYRPHPPLISWSSSGAQPWAVPGWSCRPVSPCCCSRSSPYRSSAPPPPSLAHTRSSRP